MRVSVCETENIEVLNGGVDEPRTRPRESGHCVPGGVVALGDSHP